VLSKPIRWNNI